MDKKNFLLEAEKLMFSYMKKLSHHQTRLFVRFANDVFNLKEKYGEKNE